MPDGLATQGVCLMVTPDPEMLFGTGGDEGVAQLVAGWGVGCVLQQDVA